MPIKHVFECAIPDDPADEAAGKVVPSHWNEDHTSPDIADVNGLSEALSDLDVSNGVTMNNLTGAVGTPEAGKTFFFAKSFSSESSIPIYKTSSGVERFLNDLQGLKLAVRWDTLMTNNNASSSNMGSPTNLGATPSGWSTNITNSKTRLRAVLYNTTNSTQVQYCGQSYSTNHVFVACGNWAGL